MVELRKLSTMTESTDEDGNVIRAHSTFVRLALPPYTIHFKSPTYMKDTTMDMLDKRVTKETVRATGQKSDVRYSTHYFHSKKTCLI